jgi:hypothetical protein
VATEIRSGEESWQGYTNILSSVGSTQLFDHRHGEQTSIKASLALNRAIRLLKDRVRSTLAGLPYILPRQLLKYLGEFVPQILNVISHSHSPSLMNSSLGEKLTSESPSVQTYSVINLPQTTPCPKGRWNASLSVQLGTKIDLLNSSI